MKRGSKFNARVGKQRIEQMALQASGKKLTFDQIWNHSIALEGEPNKAAYLKKHFGNKAGEMDGFFRGFDDSGAALQIKLTEGKYSEDEYVEPTKDEVLRAQITDAVATEMTRDSDTANWAVQGIDEAYLADDGMKGDVARAMLECESREQ